MKIGRENEKLEFKKTTAELKEGVISMAAILNKHGGGELYFGVRNDGTPLGQMLSDKTLRDVSQAVSNHIEPKVHPQISELVIFYRSDDLSYSEVYSEFSSHNPVGINEMQQKIMALLTENPKLTAQKLSEQLGITPRQIETNIKALKDAGKIERAGANRNGYWIVKI